eukprot:3340461-Prymnesium_polylepis.1
MAQLEQGARFVVIDDPRNPFAIATVVAVNTDATRFLSGANGQKYHVAAQALSERNLDDCHLCLLYTSPSPRDAHES